MAQKYRQSSLFRSRSKNLKIPDPPCKSIILNEQNGSIHILGDYGKQLDSLDTNFLY